ncbi:MAG: hypothetical protein A2539_07440 [Elusimicrobia bacterium RIFOXYD2_FULL_34_15]|nr:MAG: hypothetical protein A2539_07440 [Elusimicrobia bacterium RIFOXYD2_FULL_34_15]
MDIFNKIILGIFIFLIAIVFKLTALTSRPDYDGLLLTNTKDRTSNYEFIKNLNEFVIVNHTVKKGENINKIAQKYGIDVSTIRGINNLDVTYLKPEQKIWVINKKGHIHTVKNGEKLETISRKYNVNTETIIIANDFDEDDELTVGDKIFIPGIKIHFADFLLPLTRYRITSRFGSRMHPILRERRFHEGLDLGRCYRESVRASSNGKVIFAGRKGGYGKMIMISHKNGFTTRYGHLSLFFVKINQYVKAGQIIGRVGSTGLSTGPHLHFEVRKYGRAVNPLKYIGKQIFLSNS